MEFNTNEDILYDKSYTCPICNKDFKSKAIKSGKNQLVSTDLDTRAHYSIVDPLTVGVIMCPHCQYAALSKTFEQPLTSMQIQAISSAMKTSFKMQNFYIIPTLHDLIKKYKLAYFFAVIKKAKHTELGNLTLILSWLYQDANNQELNDEFVSKTYDHISLGYEQDSFPLCGFSEDTICYLLAALAYKQNDLDRSKQLASKLITSPGVPPNIKDKARRLKELLFEH